MTPFEHAMCGATLALASGCHRKLGWPVVAMAGVAGLFPDWDGLSIILGGGPFDQTHRVWGHNLLVASSSGILIGGLGYLWFRSAQGRRIAIRLQLESDQNTAVSPFSLRSLVLWLVVGLLASLSHLPADMVYSKGPQVMRWPISPYWPFSDEKWGWDIADWGDLSATMIFVGEMFALWRWRGHSQAIAVLTLLALHGYIGYCWLAGGAGFATIIVPTLIGVAIVLMGLSSVFARSTGEPILQEQDNDDHQRDIQKR